MTQGFPPHTQLSQAAGYKIGHKNQHPIRSKDYKRATHRILFLHELFDGERVDGAEVLLVVVRVLALSVQIGAHAWRHDLDDPDQN